MMCVGVITLDVGRLIINYLFPSFFSIYSPTASWARKKFPTHKSRQLFAFPAENHYYITVFGENIMVFENSVWLGCAPRKFYSLRDEFLAWSPKLHVSQQRLVCSWISAFISAIFCIFTNSGSIWAIFWMAAAACCCRGSILEMKYLVKSTFLSFHYDKQSIQTFQGSTDRRWRV